MLRLPRVPPFTTPRVVAACALPQSSGLIASSRRWAHATSNTGLIRRTQAGALMSPWGIIGRVIFGVVLELSRTIFVEWMSKQKEQQAEEAQYATTAASSMSVPEALSILRLTVPDPKNVVAPLQDAALREAAKANFDRFMARAQQSGEGRSDYLAGKFSGAYRLLVDADWDKAVRDTLEAAAAANGTSGGGTASPGDSSSATGANTSHRNG
jgi:hypothetical protein